jgi:hypothetical protein
MLSTPKGAFSTRLLAAKSNHTVSRASLYLALGLALLIAILSAIFAFAQWRVAGNLVQFQQQSSMETASRIESLAAMAKHQSNAHRATLNALLSRDTLELQEADALRKSNLEAYRTLIGELSQTPGLEEAGENLLVLTKQYDALSENVVDLFSTGKIEEALDLRINRLRSLYNEWQMGQEHFSKEVAHEGRKQQEIHSAVTRTTKTWLAGLLLAPLAIIALGAASIAAILGLNSVTQRGGDSWQR